MKKLLLTLVMSLALCGMGFAQYESHWPDFYYPTYPLQQPIVAAIQIDGQIVTAESNPDNWDALEVAFFVGDECRGAGVEVGDYDPTMNYLYNGYVEDYGDPYPTLDGTAIYYDTPGETVTVKMYDHVNNIEYNVCTVTLEGEPYTILTGGDNVQGWLDPENPIMLNFTSPAPPCAAPTDLAVTDVTSEEAVLSWIGSSESYNVQYKASTAEEWTVISNVNGTTYTISELEANTTYNVQVQSICGETQSEWSDVFEFTTALTEYTWNVNEPGWTEPESGANVEIPENSVVIIPDGCIAIANEIILPTTSQIIIEDGGELIHTNEVELTMQMNLEGYNPSAKDGGYVDHPEWYMIASPIAPSISVEATGLVTSDNYDNIDLYYFDPAGDSEGNAWINYKFTANGFTALENTKGYLYANPNPVFVTFYGNTIATAETTVELDNVNGGWNLLGNPFTCKAYIDMPYYILSGDGVDGTGILPTAQDKTIPAMRGFFVQPVEDAGEKVLVTTCKFNIEPYEHIQGSGYEDKAYIIPKLNMNVTQNNAVIDRAILRFDGGYGLDKFQLDANRTSIYMSKNGKDYAIVSSDSQGVQPVSFKAEHNGSYTIDFTAEEVSFNYLHLIDNMTGADVDLLATPSYTFNAKTTDYASRFKLVFATGNNSNEDNFAFMSNGNLVINNEGKATVQVIDVTGRILSSESINGSASINIDAAAGVYMIRLINGNDVKVQKMVVR